MRKRKKGLRRYIRYSGNTSIRRSWRRLRTKTKKRILYGSILAAAVFFAAAAAYVWSEQSDYSERPDITIAVGDYVQMGVYNNKPILWRCVDIDSNGPLMLSDKILCLKAFDAAGNVKTGSHSRGFSGGSRRKASGSNYWADSNIRCWLNSVEPSGKTEWKCGNAPVKKSVTYNAYADEAGFLNDFTASDLKYIKKVKQKIIIDGYENAAGNTIAENAYKYNNNIDSIMQNYDTAISEQAEDRIFLLDVKQLNTVYKNKEKLGEKYYVAFPTADAVEGSEYKDETLDEYIWWYYWLRTPNATDESSIFVKVMAPNGRDTGSLEANDGRMGIRPAFYLSTKTLNITSGTGRDTDPYRLQKLEQK